MFFLKMHHFQRLKIIEGYVNNPYYYIKQTKKFVCTLKANNYISYVHKKTYLSIVLCYNNDQLNQSGDLNVQIKVNLPHLLISNNKFCTLVTDPNKFGNISRAKYEKIEMDEKEKEEEAFAESVEVPRSERNTYNKYVQLIKSHLMHNNFPLALSVLDLMKREGAKPSSNVYNLLIAAFAKQGDVKQCFKLYKQMRDRRIVITPSIYCHLVIACSETDDTKAALNYLSYLQDHFCNNNLSLNSDLYSAIINAYGRHKQILTAFKIADEANDKGICSPKIFSSLFMAAISDKENGLKYSLMLWHKMRIRKIKPDIFHYNLLLTAIKRTKFGDLKANDTLIPNSMNTQIKLVSSGKPDLLESPPVLNVSLVATILEQLMFLSNESIPLDLNVILEKNPLLLFGGFLKLLQRMEDDNVEPNLKTLTLIMELLPPTFAAEEEYLKYIESKHIKLDITFFNSLIKKRNVRNRCEDAKDVLNKIQYHHLNPNIITFGVLAIGCKRLRDGIELLEQMDSINYAPNFAVLETLLYNACYGVNFKYIDYLMSYISKNNIEISENMINILERFNKITMKTIRNMNHRTDSAKINEVEYNRFRIKFESWKGT